MSAYLTIFKVFAMMYALMSSSVTMDAEQCLPATDRLYMIDGYSQQLLDNVSYYNFINKSEQCIFNNTGFYQMQIVGVTNESNGTFHGIYDDPHLILCTAKYKGAFVAC